MSFNSNPSRVEYVVTSSTTKTYTFNFAIFHETDLIVYKVPSGVIPDDTIHRLAPTSDYTVTVNGEDGGFVELVNNPTVDDSIIIQRNLPIDRTVDFVNNGGIYSDILNNDQDYQTYLISDLVSIKDKFIRIPNSVVGFDTNIPAPEANGLLQITTDGTGIEFNTDIGEHVRTVSDNIDNVNAVGADIDNVNAVATDLSNVDIVSNSITSVNTVATNIDNVNTVATDITNVNITATNIASVVTVGNSIDNVNAVGNSIDNVNAVGNSIDNVNAVATDLTNVDIVATNIYNVNAVGADIDNVNAVATDIINVNLVGNDITNVNTVATDIADINTVATDITNVNTVVTNIADVNTTATNIANVNTTATNIADINTVATDITNVNTVATDITNVNTVVTNIANVNTVATDIANVNTVATDITNVNTTATNIIDIGVVTDNITHVNTVSTNIADVNTVATNIADVNTVATNIADVTNYADTWYGPKAIEPTLRNDGSPMVVGDSYFDTTSNYTRRFDGTVWSNVFSGDFYSQSEIDNLLNAKAPLLSPALTGTPTAPTATAGTNTTQVATTAFVLANSVNTLGDLGITTSATELNYVDGVTSNIQTQLNGKLSTTGKAADSDLLDGKHSTYFYVNSGDSNVDPNVTLDPCILTNHANSPSTSYYWHIQTQFYSSVGGNCSQIAVQYNSGNDMYVRSRYSSTWTAWSKVWTNTNDGAGSGLDADKLDGLDSTAFARQKATATVYGGAKMSLSGTTLTITTT